jgi:hypothetical protein
MAETCSGEININKHLKKVVGRDGSSNNIDTSLSLKEELSG